MKYHIAFDLVATDFLLPGIILSLLFFSFEPCWVRPVFFLFVNFPLNCDRLSIVLQFSKSVDVCSILICLWPSFLYSEFSHALSKETCLKYGADCIVPFIVEVSKPTLYTLERLEKLLSVGVQYPVEEAEYSDETPESISLTYGTGNMSLFPCTVSVLWLLLLLTSHAVILISGIPTTSIY